MGKSYEELIVEHNEAAKKYNELHKKDPGKAAKYQAEYKKLWKQIQDLKPKNRKDKKDEGGEE
jgi:cobalamin biosynthesis Co2+ chelatase CbiK